MTSQGMFDVSRLVECDDCTYGTSTRHGFAPPIPTREIIDHTSFYGGYITRWLTRGLRLSDSKGDPLPPSPIILTPKTWLITAIITESICATATGFDVIRSGITDYLS
jgi:hypothetical protein